jgi:hypothetical protein
VASGNGTRRAYGKNGIHSIDGQLYEFNNFMSFGAMNSPANGSRAVWAYVAPVFGHM